MNIEKSKYELLAAISVAEHVEKKGNLSYLSWVWACDQLLRADYTANWAYNPSTTFPDGTMMVSCTVTAFCKPMTMQLPVMDYRNKAISNPDAFAINTAMMRCLVKAIALHGLGLYIYAGEDLPFADVGDNFADHAKPKGTITPATGTFEAMNEEEQKYLKEVAAYVKELLDNQDPKGAVRHILSLKLDADERVALNTLFDSKQRSAMKTANEEMKKEKANGLKS